MLWDRKADVQKSGDQLRDITPVKTKTDDEGFTHYIFDKNIFDNPWYDIPKDDLELFKDFLEGGSRSYPSDGNIPVDIIADETRKVLNKIQALANDPDSKYCIQAQKAFKNGKNDIIRGTLKLYMEKYTTRDWRRKRFTDDIDFWCFDFELLDAVLSDCGFNRNKKTGEWEKRVSWHNPKTDEIRHEVLYAANNVNQILDFGAGSYLEGSSLKEIFQKKIKRGHDVDLSDMINVAMVRNHKNPEEDREWVEAWNAFEQAANTRNKRTISNFISLCRYSLAVADHLENVGKAIEKYHNMIFNSSKYPKEKIKEICRISIHWQRYYEKHGAEETRKMIHEFLIDQVSKRDQYAENLRNFVHKLLKLVNSKLKHQKIVFEIV
ncbi:MAG: hypothetical protein EU541_00820 [Promethearchaeota archaeon]|nr:MAG: hypothetical protein EU541_00820 [Candidatus Lokiarchaeota archaeon]